MSTANSTTRRKWVVGLVISLLGLVAWSGWRLASAHDEAMRAAKNTADCRQLAQAILDAKRQPTRAVLATRSDKQMAECVMGCASEVKLPAEFVVRIEPQNERRVADTDYKEQPTTVRIEGATLAQLVTFLCQLSLNDPDLHVSSMDLVAPRHELADDEKQEPWDANLTLTYWRFDPKSTPANR